MARSKQVELNVAVHYEDGMYWAEVAEYPGLFASGETLDELAEAIGEAWVLYTHDEKPAGQRERVATQSMNMLVPA